MIMHNIFAMENKWKHLEMLLSDVCKMYITIIWYKMHFWSINNAKYSNVLFKYTFYQSILLRIIIKKQVIFKHVLIKRHIL